MLVQFLRLRYKLKPSIYFKTKYKVIRFESITLKYSQLKKFILQSYTFEIIELHCLEFSVHESRFIYRRTNSVCNSCISL